MASHMSCIGIDASDEESFKNGVIRMTGKGKSRARPDGGGLILSRDSSGAALAAHTHPDGGIECVTPSFFGESRIQIRPTGWAADPECRHCDRLLIEALDEDGSMCYPMAIQLEDIGVSRDRIALDEPVRASIIAFAEDVTAWETEDRFIASQEKEPKFAAESLIPSGLFQTEGEDAQPAQANVMMGARVLRSEVRTNTITGGKFIWASIRTFGGEYDAVLPAGEIPEPREGGILHGTFWVVGRIVE